MKPTKLEAAIRDAKIAVRNKADGHLYGKDRPRWMPAVLVRKADLRELIAAAERQEG